MSEIPKFEIEETTEHKQRVAFERDALKAIILARLGRTDFDAIPQATVNDELLDTIARLSITIDDLRDEFHKTTCVRDDEGGDEDEGLVVDAH